ncbi:MAG: glycosyltransferase family 2 protein [Streptosporangiaceae bacterium]
MAPAPLLSVILPVHGVQDYLPQCLASVLHQAGDDTEVIAVDDASPDGCGELLDEAAAADRRLLVLHRAQAGGPGAARNAGLDRCRGAYVWFVDADDQLAPGAINAVRARLAADAPDVLLIDYEDLFADGSTGPSPGAQLLRAAPAGTFTLGQQPQLIDLTMTSWSKVLRREFLVSLGVRFGPGIHEDVPVSCAALLCAERISALDRVCYRYRRRAGSFMATSSRDQFAIFDAYHQVFELAAKRRAGAGAAGPVGEREADRLQTALFERAVWHYSTVLATGGLGVGPLGRPGLVPRRDRREFFRLMHEDFARYPPPGYQLPGGARGAKFGLIARGAYWTYELLEPVNRVRVALLGARRPGARAGAGESAAG